MRFACIPDASCTRRSPLSSAVLVPWFQVNFPMHLPVRYTVLSLPPFLVHSLMHSPIVPVYFTGVPPYATLSLFSHGSLSSMFPGFSLCIPLKWTCVLPCVLSCTTLCSTLPPSHEFLVGCVLRSRCMHRMLPLVFPRSSVTLCASVCSLLHFACVHCPRKFPCILFLLQCLPPYIFSCAPLYQTSCLPQ